MTVQDLIDELARYDKHDKIGVEIDDSMRKAYKRVMPI